MTTPLTDLDDRLRTLDAARAPVPDETLPVRIRAGMARQRRRRRQAASLGVAGLVAALAIGVAVVPPASPPDPPPADRVARTDAAADRATDIDIPFASEGIAPPRSLALIELDLVRQRMAALAIATRAVDVEAPEPTS